MGITNSMVVFLLLAGLYQMIIAIVIQTGHQLISIFLLKVLLFIFGLGCFLIALNLAGFIIKIS